MADERVVKEIHKIFFVGHDHYATGMSQNGEVKYITQEGRPGIQGISNHLDGSSVLGAYQLSDNDKIAWACWDVDSTDLKVAKNMADQICDVLGDLPHAVEFSGNKGYHIFLFFKGMVDAAGVKFAMDSISASLGFRKTGESHVEVFPKQDKLTNSNPLGNLIKVPLGVHPKTNNRSVFVDRTRGWENGPELDPLECLSNTITPDELQEVLSEKDPEAEIVNIVSNHWHDGQRHDLSLYLAGLFCVQGWERDRAEDIVSRVCDMTGDADVQNRIDAVNDTYAKYANGKAVMGFQGLAEVMPTGTLNRLVELCGKVSTSDSVVAIDAIRLAKGRQAFQKVRSSVNVVMNHLNERGRVVRNGIELFWLDHETKQLLSFESPFWNAKLYRQFAINQQESFGRQVMEGILQTSMSQASEVKVHRRSYWDDREGILYLNLGSEFIYTIDGKRTQVIHNGEGPIMFRNHEDGMDMPNLLDPKLGIKPNDPWDYLVNDVSFAQSEDASADPMAQKELAKGWIIGIGVPQAQPTRAIMAALGPPGSGKTTFARRIVRFFEDPQDDVISLATDKPDSFRTIVSKRRVMVLDNLEKTKATWLLDDLNRISTGTKFEIRKLWTSNQVYEIVPNVFVIFTTTQMPFQEDTLYSRVLPLEMDTILERRTEFEMQRELQRNMAGSWRGMIEIYEAVVAAMRLNTTFTAPTGNRLVDFSAFITRIADCGVLDGKLARLGIDSMANQQKMILHNSSPLVQTLEIWLGQVPDIAAKKHTAGELQSSLSEVARRHHINWIWSSPQGLAQHIKMIDSQLMQYYGMDVSEEYNSSQGRTQKVYQFKIAKARI